MADDDDWYVPEVAQRHQVLLVDLRPGGRAELLPDNSSDAWPVEALGVLRKLAVTGDEASRRSKCLDRFDFGVLPRLLRLALRDVEASTDVLDVLALFAAAAPEIAAEIRRNYLQVVRHVGRQIPSSASAAAIVKEIEAVCHRRAQEIGDEEWHEWEPASDQHWLLFGRRHYVVRFAEADPAVPPGGAPPLAFARVAAFGRLGEGGLVDAVGRRRQQTGARLWCAGVLLARAMLQEPIRSSVEGRVVLEFGCGIGITGITAASYSSAAKCVLTDVEPCLVDAARANLKHAGGSAATRGKAEQLDLRDLEAVRRLSSAEGASVVVGSDLVYGTLGPEELACAVAQALPRGGRAWLLLPLRYRSSMSRQGFINALVQSGLEVVSTQTLDDGGAHAAFSACEDEQEYVLFEAAATHSEEVARNVQACKVQQEM